MPPRGEGAGRGGRYQRLPENWTNVRICRCGYSTPITTTAFAHLALTRHRCRDRMVLVIVGGDLPPAVTAALGVWVRTKNQLEPVVIDTVAVQRAADGLSVALNPHERFAVYAVLRLRQVPAMAIRSQLRLSWGRIALYRNVVGEVA